MAQQSIVLGTVGNDGTGTNMRVAGGMINSNFTELYGHGIFTTMRPAFTGAANAAALIADITGALGQLIIIPPGTYTMNPVTLNGPDAGATTYTDGRVNIRMMPGSKLVPDASLHAYATAANVQTGRFFRFYNCNTRLYGFNIDGLNGADVGIRADFGELRCYDTTIINMGFVDLVYPGTKTFISGTVGIIAKTCDHFEVVGYVGRNFIGLADGSYGTNPGKVNHIMPYECFDVVVRDVTCSGGAGEDNDFIHILDLRTIPLMRCCFENLNFYYNHNTRRCMKFQGGYHTVRHAYAHIGSDFVPVAAGAAYARVTGVTKANPAVVSSSIATTALIANGQTVRFANVPGMVELNGNDYIVANAVANTSFELSGVNSTGFTTFTPSGNGEVRRIYKVVGVTTGTTTTITVDTPHLLTNNQPVTFSGVVGTVELNGNTYKLSGITAATGVSTFTLTSLTDVPVDSTGWGAWVSDGEMVRNTEIGVQNLNCIDWAGSVEGSLHLTDSRLDARGFAFGVSASVGPLGRVIVDNCEIIMSKVRGIRNFPEINNYSEVAPGGFYMAGNTLDCELRSSTIFGSVISCQIQGARISMVDNIFDDPMENFATLGVSATRLGQTFSRNKCITRTPNACAITQTIRIQNITNGTYENNELFELGNTTHTATFIAATNASATGIARNNIAPTGTIAFKSISGANIAVSGSSRTPMAPLVDFASIGNITTGEDNLNTHVIPAYTLNWADETVVAEWHGTKANNANTKTIKLYIGATLVMTKVLTASVAASWLARLTITSTGVSTQRCVAEFYDGGVATTPYEGATLDTTEASTAAITVKATGEATATNDIINTFSILKSFTGRTLT